MGKGRKTEKISTLLGPDTRIEGTIQFEDTIRVDCQVKGRIGNGGGRVIIGEEASVRARIEAHVVIIMGEVLGNVEAGDKVEIRRSGRVVGDITTSAITIEPGGVLDGRCFMKERPASSEAPLPSIVNKTTVAG
jgi:cytoskeletal protein CcmA (bactofilin family)